MRPTLFFGTMSNFGLNAFCGVLEGGCGERVENFRKRAGGQFPAKIEYWPQRVLMAALRIFFRTRF